MGSRCTEQYCVLPERVQSSWVRRMRRSSFMVWVYGGRGAPLEACWFCSREVHAPHRRRHGAVHLRTFHLCCEFACGQGPCLWSELMSVLRVSLAGA